ncbi:MAG: aldo/keto reductase [Rhizobiaceae bacterium]|nr:aldo/keto reductase [Rhizobiaceae bacterium]
MKKRRLGTSELEVAPLCFGGNVFGWTADEKSTFALLDAFVDAGFNLIDTADMYSNWVPGNHGGESETLIGKWLRARGNRDKVIISSKFGLEMGPGKSGLSPTYMRSAIEGSLRRLQTDYIDLYQAHEDDPNTPMQDTLEAFAGLVDAGKVRVIGASNFTAKRFAQALRISDDTGLPRYQSLQPIYNLYDRGEFETGLAKLVQAERVGVISYYALAQGFLSGKYRSAADHAGSERGKRIAPRYLNERGTRILAGLDSVVGRTGASHAQVALAWVMAQPGITAPIVSASSVEQFSELAAATELELDKAALDMLDSASTLQS